MKAYLRLVYNVFKGLGLFRPTCWPKPDDLLSMFFFATGFVNKLQVRSGYSNRLSQAENKAFNRLQVRLRPNNYDTGLACLDRDLA